MGCGGGQAGAAGEASSELLSVALSAKMSLIVCRSSKVSLTLGQPAAGALLRLGAPRDLLPSILGLAKLCQHSACMALGKTLCCSRTHFPPVQLLGPQCIPVGDHGQYDDPGQPLSLPHGLWLCPRCQRF